MRYSPLIFDNFQMSWQHDKSIMTFLVLFQASDISSLLLCNLISGIVNHQNFVYAIQKYFLNLSSKEKTLQSRIIVIIIIIIHFQ